MLAGRRFNLLGRELFFRHFKSEKKFNVRLSNACGMKFITLTLFNQIVDIY